MSRKETTAQRIVESAAKLFLIRGFHDVTMDHIAECAEITKVTVYQHFQSKEALLAECLRWRLQRREEALDQVSGGDASPRESLLSVFRWIETNSRTGEFSGCAFLKATSEVAQQYEEVREVAKTAKRLLRQRFCALAKAAGCKDPAKAGAVCALLIEGAQALSLVEKSAHPFATAREQAAAVFGQGCRKA